MARGMGSVPGAERLESRSCFSCWQRRRPCERCNSGFCVDCRQNRFPHQSQLTNAPPLYESNVGHALQDIVKSIMPYFSRLQDPSEDITVGIALTTTHKQNRDKIESRSVSLDLRIDKPFWPMFNGVTEHLDKLVWTYLSLQLRGTEGGSPLLPHVSKAGGYLCLLFPAAGAADSVHKSDGVDACNGDIERRLEAHFARFSIIRFAELIDGTMTAIRSIDTAHMTRNECLDAIAAAGVLYCELEYVNQGLRNGSLRLLWDHVNLRKALKTWLNTMSKELLIRIRLTCGHFPIWSELLEQPLNRVRRFHNIKTISLSIRSPVHPPSLPISPSWPVSPPEICHSSSSNPSFMSTAFTTPEQDISDFEPSRQGPALGHGGPPYSLPEIEQILPNFPQRALSSKAPTRVPPGGWNPELLCDNLAESEDSNNISVGGFDDGLSAYMDWEDVFQIESQQTISGVQSPKISSDAEEAPFHVPACLPSGIQADTSGTMAFGRASTQYGYWDSDMLSHLT